MSTATRRAAAVLATGMFAVTGAGVAHAALSVRLTAAQSVGSASWGVTPAGTDGTGSPALTWTDFDGLLSSAKYFRAVNTGTTALSGTTWTLTASRTDNSSNNVPSVRFEVCSTGWDLLTGTCLTGTTTAIGTTQDKATLTVPSTVAPTAPASSLLVRALPLGGKFNQGFRVTVGTSVSASQLRADVTTNS